VTGGLGLLCWPPYADLWYHIIMAIYSKPRLPIELIALGVVFFVLGFTMFGAFLSRFYSQPQVLGVSSVDREYASLPSAVIDSFYEVFSSCDNSDVFATWFLKIRAGAANYGGGITKSIEYKLSVEVPFADPQYWILPADMSFDGTNLVAYGTLAPGGEKTYTFSLNMPAGSLEAINEVLTARLTVLGDTTYSADSQKSVTLVLLCGEGQKNDVAEEVPPVSIPPTQVSTQTGEFKEVLKADLGKTCACYSKYRNLVCKEYKDVDIDVRCSTFCASRGYDYGEKLTCDEIQAIWGGL